MKAKIEIRLLNYLASGVELAEDVFTLASNFENLSKKELAQLHVHLCTEGY